MNRQVPDKEKIFAIFVPEKDLYTEYIAKEPIQLNKKAAQIKNGTASTSCWLALVRRKGYDHLGQQLGIFLQC